MQPSTSTPIVPPIIHNQSPVGGEFIIETEKRERLAELTYTVSSGVASINHTWVRPDLRARGIARQLLDASVDWARGANIRLRPVCSYAQAVLARDKSAADILA